MAGGKDLLDTWRARWPEAMRAWGRFITVHDPLMCATNREATSSGLSGSFAMFRLDDRTVVLNLAAVAKLGLDDYPVEVMAHEVGHHVLCPADLADHGRLLTRVRRALPNLEQHAPMIANLYADLLINDRLLRSRGLRMDEVYTRLATGPMSPLWRLYLRMYEILWALPSTRLTGKPVEPAVDGDAQLGARLARVYATDWLAGAGGFAMLCYRYLAEENEESQAAIGRRVCVAGIGGDAEVSGLTEADLEEIVHPALDPRVNDFVDAEGDSTEPAEEAPQPSGGQYREPFEYGQILRQLGLNLSEEDAGVRYYRERAAPHLVPFPVRLRHRTGEPLPEGVGPWDVGEALEAVDWLATTLRSPAVVPGVTTVQRLYGTVEGDERDPRPVDLDLYVDSSGSMPNPRQRVSYLTLAGAILALSALRVGARVQATLWSGTNQFSRTDGFVRDETAVLRILTGFFGGGTAFPLHVLRDTYANRGGRPTHIVVISDEGVDTMFGGTDEQGRPGAGTAAEALAAADAGGTLVLNLWSDEEQARIAAMSPGWDVHRVTDWADLVEFAAAFSRKQYERSPT